MKLVKLLDKPLSAVAGIVGIPESDKITTKESLLVSDDRWTLLLHSNVRMYTVEEFSEVAVANIGEFDKTKTYVIKDFIKPSDVDKPATLAEYKIGDYFFVYCYPTKNGQRIVHPGPAPVMDKPKIGYKFTLQEYVDAKNKFDRAMKTYLEALEQYEEDMKDFFENGEGADPKYGWLIQKVSDTQYKVIADFSFETTKDTAQFGVMGKLPKEVATKVTIALGGLAEDDSIKGLTVAEIIEKALGLEVEEELVGQFLPKDEEDEG